jgi:gluconolactonase
MPEPGSNGLTLDTDGSLLLAEHGNRRISRLDSLARPNDGTLGSRRIFFDAGQFNRGARRGVPDGMAIDARGNLWATGPGGVLIIDANGRHLGSILTGQATANCTFDETESTLYITADALLARLVLS